MNLEIKSMTMEDYDDVMVLWQKTEGIGLSKDDDKECIAAYLLRNPGLSFTAKLDGKVVGAVLCGHDGRRGYLHHLAVDSRCRKCGIGKALTETCLSALEYIGISKCNIFVYSHNEGGREFWNYTGWNQRKDLLVMQKWTGE